MFDIYKKEITWGGRPLSIETGHVARQADGAVIVTYGETVVLCTAVATKSAREGLNFFPLTVNYMEKTYAAGKIPGGFFKREGRPSEKETLTSRLIDRPVRPLFPDGFRNETQIITTVLSHDLENDPDIVALVGASAALTLSGLSFFGPIGAARVGFINGEYVLNPLPEQLAESQLDLVVAGTSGAVLMVESQAKELSEKEMLGAVMYGHEQMQPVIDMIIDLAEEAAKDPWELAEAPDTSALQKKISDLAEKDLRKAYGETIKQKRTVAIGEVKDKVFEALAEDESIDSEQCSKLLKSLEKEIVRGNILKDSKRIDGRNLD